MFMEDNMKIDGVVVLYNPTEDVIENIKSYINDINILYVVDNSEKYNKTVIAQIKKISKCKYINNNGNKGIASALNIGAKLAIKDGAKWLLTMDQDSKATPEMVKFLKECIFQYKNNNVGIVSPFHASKYNKEAKDKKCKIQKMVMTSGNLLNLDAYSIVGPFAEDLFIDYVDNEYCLRLNKNNFIIIENAKAILEHNLGELSRKKIFWKNIYCYNYSYIRYYYRSRNVILVGKKYNYVDKDYLIELLKDSIKIILYETDKMKKFLYITKGILDGLNNKTGKLGEYRK